MSAVCVFTAVMLVFSSVHGQVDGVYRQVNTSYGTIRGMVDSQLQVPVAKFQGIPYAKPPVGPLRFKAPVEPEKWNSVKDAFYPGNICVQLDYPQFGDIFKNDTKSEDCLFLNIFSPETNNATGALPVMVWVHGGGYVFGASHLYDGTVLAQKGVIVVTFNYRLDAFGFMSTEDASMPGNYGMMDQVEALKWVQKNIAAFGGDPKQVTIFGESAGSASVSLLALSPLTKGLFKRAIMESGVSISPWAISTTGYRVSPRITARLIATAVGCSDLDDASKLLPCLQGVDGEALLNASGDILLALDTSVTMNPRVEQVFNFLPDDPINLLTRGEFNHVDTLRGFNADEMGIFLGPFYFSNGTIPQDRVDDIYLFNLKTFTDLDQEYLSGIMKGLQLTNVPTVPDKVRHAIESNEDLYFAAATMTEINLVSQRSPEMKHYLYEFNHKPSNSPYPIWMNATHSEEIPFVFGVDSTFYTKFFPHVSADDVAVSGQMMEMWTNFAKTGDPTATLAKGGVTWSPYRPDSPNYLFIDPTSEQRVWSRMEVFDFYQKVLNVLDGYVAPSDNIVG